MSDISICCFHQIPVNRNVAKAALITGTACVITALCLLILGYYVQQASFPTLQPHSVKWFCASGVLSLALGIGALIVAKRCLKTRPARPPQHPIRPIQPPHLPIRPHRETSPDQRQHLRTLVQHGADREDQILEKRKNLNSFQSVKPLFTVAVLDLFPFPVDILRVIFYFLTAPQIAKCSHISKSWYVVSFHHPVAEKARLHYALQKCKLTTALIISPNKVLAEDSQLGNFGIWNLENNTQESGKEIYDSWPLEYHYRSELFVKFYYSSTKQHLVIYKDEEEFKRSRGSVILEGICFLSQDYETKEFYTLEIKDKIAYLKCYDSTFSHEFSVGNTEITSFAIANNQIFLGTKRGTILHFDQRGEPFETSATKENEDYITKLYVQNGILLSFSLHGFVRKWKILGDRLLFLSQQEQEGGVVKIVEQQNGKLFGFIEAETGQNLFKGWEFYDTREEKSHEPMF